MIVSQNSMNWLEAHPFLSAVGTGCSHKIR